MPIGACTSSWQDPPPPPKKNPEDSALRKLTKKKPQKFINVCLCVCVSAADGSWRECWMLGWKCNYVCVSVRVYRYYNSLYIKLPPLKK